MRNMSRDRHLGRSLKSTSPHYLKNNSGNISQEPYYDNWDEEVEHSQGIQAHHHHPYQPHHHRASQQLRRVGRSEQVTSTSRNSHEEHLGRIDNEYIDDDEATGDGNSSVVSYSSGYGRPPRNTTAQNHHQNNRRSNYTEPTVRVHYIPQEQYYPSQQPSGTRMSEIPERFRDEKDGSEMYVTDSTLMKQQRPPPSVYSHYSEKSRAPSEMSSVKTKTSRKGGVIVETMAAPNPFCPNTKGVCCLMVLVNLGLILVTLGFSIVLQLFEPPFVWYCGIAFLIVGFIALIASIVFCVHLCHESREIRRAQGTQPGELYWTHHWQKRIPIPGMGGREREKDDVSTVYSARTEYDDQSHQPDKFYSRNEIDRGHGHHTSRDMTPIHSYRN